MSAKKERFFCHTGQLVLTIACWNFVFEGNSLALVTQLLHLCIRISRCFFDL